VNFDGALRSETIAFLHELDTKFDGFFDRGVVIGELHINMTRSDIQVLLDEGAKLRAFGGSKVADDDQAMLLRELRMGAGGLGGDAIETSLLDIHNLTFEGPWLSAGWVILQRPKIGYVPDCRRVGFLHGWWRNKAVTSASADAEGKWWHW
jgi:hypothetical protein